MGYLEGLEGWYLSGDVSPPRFKELPPIDSQWEVCAKYLVPFMREKGYEYNLESDGYFWWITRNNKKMWIRIQGAELKDDNIAEAACKAFMEVEF